MTEALFLLAAAAAFFLSAYVGLGGSLVMVPAAVLLLGTKEGIALAALLLALNNLAKVVAYRDSLPVRRALPLVGATFIGSAVGAALLFVLPERLVLVVVAWAVVMSLVAEIRGWRLREAVMAPGLAGSSGLLSGVSGTSGPLKGVAVRSLGLGRMHTVGAATLMSLVGDVTKTFVFIGGGLLAAEQFRLAAAALPLMVLATWSAALANRTSSEGVYRVAFWLVMGGYLARLVVG
jgi:uncharacterized protein